MKLVPIDSNSPQLDLAEALATLLAKEGVAGLAAMPLAIGIMAALQRAIDSDEKAAIAYLERY